MYEKSCEIIYSMISQRIHIKRKSLGLTCANVYPLDPKLLGAIERNKRHDKKNSYLIPSGRRGIIDVDYVDTISDNLNLENSYELVIGNQDEIASFSGHLFFQLFLDALKSEDKETVELINQLLFTYIPYAIADFYISIVDENSVLSSLYVNTKYRYDIEDVVIERDNAIVRLYLIYKQDFEKMLREMFTENHNTVKLNKRFSDFVREKLVPFMLNDRSAYTVTPDVRKLLLERYREMLAFVERDFCISPDAVYYHENKKDKLKRDSLNRLLLTDANYINDLAQIQSEIEDKPDFIAIKNNWNYELFI